MKTAQMSVQMIDYCGSDLSVVNAARVSFEKESDEMCMQDEKLISYLARHKHTSPFNHAFASFRVKAPIFVARQLVKHKFLPWNEVSRRYVDSEPEFYIPSKWRLKAENVKQGSSDDFSDIDWEYIVNESTLSSLELYKDMLQSKVCPEMARMVLPLNCMTEWIWSGTLGAWSDMCRLRLDSHSQKETREIAEQISHEMSFIFPVSWEALMSEVK